jgi:chromate reductase, NAD(P)H dehydrogenase (quinone)
VTRSNEPAAAEVCEDSIPALRVDHLDISDLPLLNTDLETDGGQGFPPAVEAFRGKVREADCILFAAPEYNYSIASTSPPFPLSFLHVKSNVHFVPAP